MAMKTSHTLEVSDRYEAVGEGRPTKLKRSFDKIGTSTHVSVSNPVIGDKETDIPATSELEGVTVLFSWNDSAGEYDVAFADGADGDEELLENLTEDLDLRGFLPDKEVSDPSIPAFCTQGSPQHFDCRRCNCLGVPHDFGGCGALEVLRTL